MKIIFKILVFPLVILSKLIGEKYFRQFSELLSVIPTYFGDIIRYSFYSQVLNNCGKKVRFSIGTILSKKDISIGENVYIGPYCAIGLVDIGDDVMISNNCILLSGSRQHGYERRDIPMRLQKGVFERKKIGNDCWIGSNSVIMNDVAKGSIVAAGTIITKKVDSNLIVLGNLPRAIRER